MKKQLFYLIFFIFIISDSCEKDKIINKSIIGKWTWIKTYYGFTNSTETYKDRGYNFEILFDDYYYYEYKDNNLLSKMQYDLVVKADSSMYVKYENGLEEIISYSKDTLLLYYYQGEGSLAYYTRK
ncbi:MAG: hypothetical protein IPO78_13225 [Saprospiraceae bacterium]|nr:hypothetical protein [Saprospiraceae bacterium]MBK8451113.1 hypothetical protein [Saprospiraceae bacterium]MBK9722560.1 hypothetical protein [Saprospiraceae bacterium]MBK9729579.1 hypothetical protein [Saprospiraceae bacterium]